MTETVPKMMITQENPEENVKGNSKYKRFENPNYGQEGKTLRSICSGGIQNETLRSTDSGGIHNKTQEKYEESSENEEEFDNVDRVIDSDVRGGGRREQRDAGGQKTQQKDVEFSQDEEFYDVSGYGQRRPKDA